MSTGLRFLALALAHAQTDHVSSGGGRPHDHRGPHDHREPWTHPVGAPARNVSTPFGEVRLGDCATTRESPGVQKRASGRWVLVKHDYVAKHIPQSDNYRHERDITSTLSKYPHFVKLLGHDDACQILYLEKLDKEVGRLKQYNPNLTEDFVRRQLEYIFAVLDLEELTPSTEIFNGKNNLIVDEAGTITFFDFGAYASDSGFNATANHVMKDCLTFTWRRRLDVTWKDCLDVARSTRKWIRAHEMTPETRVGARRI